MKLDEYMAETGIRPSWFCEKLGIKMPTLWNWRKGRRVPPKAAMMIFELITGGKVTLNDWEKKK